MGGCRLSTEEKGVIVGMSRSGMSQRSIATELGMPRSTIEYVLKKFNDYGTVVTRKVVRRRCKLTHRGRRELVRILIQNRRIPLVSIIEKMTEKVCVRTLRKEIKRIGFRSCVAAKKPFLSHKHKADRLAFAKKHQSWNTLDWMHVIWTDEASFEIGKNSRQVKVWRRSYERYSWDCLAPIFKSGRTSVMIWGAFTGYEKCSIVIMPSDRRTSADFVDVVYEGRLSGFFYMHDDPQSLFLMEDGAPVHRSKLPQQWREAHKIKKITWPANSPDLNPIENVWMILKDFVQKETRPNNKDELIKSIERAWEAISMETLEILLASMPHRMKAVINAGGGSTRW